MKKFLHENRILIIGLLLPIILVFIFEAAYLSPKLFIKPPQYDFLYITSPYPHDGARFEVVKNRLNVSVTQRVRNGRLPMPRLFLFQAKTLTSKEISIEIPAIQHSKQAFHHEEIVIPELKNLFINTQDTAPDEYKVELSSPNLGGAINLILLNSYKRNFVINKNGNIINITNGIGCNEDCRVIKFIGWIIPK